MAFTPLNALHAFLAVGRLRGFGAAAAELGISPSALSQSVRQLETKLGVTLLTRTTRSVALTDAGRRLLESAGPAVAQAMEALRTSTARPGEVTGTLRLSVPALALPLLLPLVTRVRARHPRIDVDVTVEDRMLDVVAAGYDAGVRFAEFVERDMVQVRLGGPYRFVVVGAPAYLERRGVPATPKDLLAHDCLCYRSNTTSSINPWELERGKKTWRVPVRGPVIANDDVRVLVPLAEAGLGLAYAFEPSIASQLSRGILRIVLEPYAGWVPGFFLYFPSRAQVSPALRAFVDQVREPEAPADPS